MSANKGKPPCLNCGYIVGHASWCANGVNPHLLGFCCRYACNETCVGCGDSENGMPLYWNDISLLIQAVCLGYEYNPGSSDLDDEQPIHVSMTLGDYRKAKCLLKRVRLTSEGVQS